MDDERSDDERQPVRRYGDDELDGTLRLLQKCFDAPRFRDKAFIEWAYNHNPVAPVLAKDITEDGERICHVGGVPLDYRSADREARILLLLNSSVSPDTQRRGVYVHAMQDLRKDTDEAGYDGFWGVTNDGSTKANLKAGHWLVRSLPALLSFPLYSPLGVRSHVVTPELLASREFLDVAGELDDFAVDKWVHRWTPEVLAWRLQFPGSRYVVHISDELFGVSVRTTFKRIPVAVVLKLLPRGNPSRRLQGGPVIAAACLAHKAPVSVYAGINKFVHVGGFALKREWLPAPLNVMYYSQRDWLAEKLDFDILEFLDFDPY